MRFLIYKSKIKSFNNKNKKMKLKNLKTKKYKHKLKRKMSFCKMNMKY